MARYMSGMSNGGQIYSSSPLEDDQLRRYVPSIFAEDRHESRTERFTYVPTTRVIAGLRQEGFQPFMAQQCRTRDASRRGFTKHMIRLRHDSRRNKDGVAHELILLNSHDGSCAYRMLSGLFRFVCANGLFTGEKLGEVRVRHSGDAVQKVIDGAYKVLDHADEVFDVMDEWRSRPLTSEMQGTYAAAALQLRYEDGQAPISPTRLLEARRVEDRGRSDLWTTFNRVQENLVKGGQLGFKRDKNNKVRRSRVRQVGGIDQSVSLNRALWTLTEGMNKILTRGASV